MNLGRAGSKSIITTAIVSLLLIQTIQSDAVGLQPTKLTSLFNNELTKSKKPQSVKPKIWSPTDNEKLIVLDPRFNKKVNPKIISFWVFLNRLNYETYSDKSFDASYININLFDKWLAFESDGFGIMAAATLSNSSRKGAWIPSEGGKTWADLSPQGTPCLILNDTIRYIDSIFTCTDIGGRLEFDGGKDGYSGRSDGVLGDGFVAGIDAPTRECNSENKSTKFYKATLVCSFREGIRVPQVSNAITVWKVKSIKEHYCILDRTLAKQKQPLVGFTEYVLINQSCPKYFGNKAARY